MMVAIAVPFVLTVIVGKKKGIDKQAQPEAAETVAAEENVTVNAMESEHDFTAFLDGEVISLKEVGDGVFSEGIVGEGLAIRPGLRQNYDADGGFPPCGGHDALERRGDSAPCGH